MLNLKAIKERAEKATNSRELTWEFIEDYDELIPALIDALERARLIIQSQVSYCCCMSSSEICRAEQWLSEVQ